MPRPPSPLRIRISRPELADELVTALVAGDCLCAPVGNDTFVVVHRAAADEAEARVELDFFLRAWESRYADVSAELY
jgi:hypothetical protein